jgi:hypothetical protein
VNIGSVNVVGFPVGFNTVMFTVASAHLVEIGVYPSDFACETTLFLLDAESRNASFMAKFAYMAL